VVRRADRFQEETYTAEPGYNNDLYDTPYITSCILRYQLIPRCEPKHYTPPLEQYCFTNTQNIQPISWSNRVRLHFYFVQIRNKAIFLSPHTLSWRGEGKIHLLYSNLGSNVNYFDLYFSWFYSVFSGTSAYSTIASFTLN
jgi:hypothetical protein